MALGGNSGRCASSSITAEAVTATIGAIFLRIVPLAQKRSRYDSIEFRGRTDCGLRHGSRAAMEAWQRLSPRSAALRAKKINGASDITCACAQLNCAASQVLAQLPGRWQVGLIVQLCRRPWATQAPACTLDIAGSAECTRSMWPAVFG